MARRSLKKLHRTVVVDSETSGVIREEKVERVKKDIDPASLTAGLFLAGHGPVPDAYKHSGFSFGTYKRRAS